MVTTMTRFNEIYERYRSLIIWLGLGELTWIGYWLLGSGNTSPGYAATTVVWIALMLAWMMTAISLANKGVYLKYTYRFSNLLGFLFVLFFSAFLFGIIDTATRGLLIAATHTSNPQLVTFHMLRLLAVGTVLKYAQGQLPLHFVIFGSIPDLLFALSAVILTVWGSIHTWGSDHLIVWHIIGLSVFLGAGISMFFSVPSPTRIYQDKPDTSIVFQFPMVLAPNFTVPLFALAHVFALIKLIWG